MLTGKSWGPADGGTPTQIVFLCHGAGANADQLIRFAANFGALLPHALFLAPNGPDRNNMGGRQWFPLNDHSAEFMQKNARAAAIGLNEYIDAALQKHGIKDYALAGFSQGAMMVLQIGLRRAHAPRAIVALSGVLVDPFTLPAQIKNRAPVLLGHGEDDPVVSPQYSRDAEGYLRDNNVPVTLIMVPGLRHGIDPRVLIPATEFLQKAFA